VSKITFDRVDGTLGTLVNDEYVNYPVKLDLEVKQLVGRDGVEDEEISKVSLASSVPDASPYTLRYSYHGKKYEQTGLRVDHGVLLKG
jgi:hypothetical protein